jgi:hypothetical protein
MGELWQRAWLGAIYRARPNGREFFHPKGSRRVAGAGSGPVAGRGLSTPPLSLPLRISPFASISEFIY